MKRALARLVGFLLAAMPAAAGSVGLQVVEVADYAGPAFRMAVWYPTTATPSPRRFDLATISVANDAPITGDHRPVIVISHGQEGALGSHADTAVALAEAGFVVAAPLHSGDNFDDQSAVGGPKWFADRSRHISVAINYLLGRWPERGHIDGFRIGAFGFSAGGTTALIAVGGVPDFQAIPVLCKTHPEFACTLWTGGSNAALTWDRRIRAAVIAAPGFGFAFRPQGLKGVHVLILLMGGSADTHVPAASNVSTLAEALGAPAWIVPGAEHFSFLVPCQGPPICRDATGFDRSAFHSTLNQAVVGFFRTTLR
jgi:predicted dienelactone hydrolase